MRTVQVRSTLLLIAAVVASALAGALLVAMAMAWLAADGRPAVAADPPPGESTLVPLGEPCRLADTRPGKDQVGERVGAIGPGETVVFAVHGTHGNCTIPSSATAVSLNVTAPTTTAAATNIRLFPPGRGSIPTVSLINPRGDGPPVANTATVRLDQNGDLAVRNEFGETHIVLDIDAAFVDTTISRLSGTIIEQAQTIESLSNRLDAVEHTIEPIGRSVVDGIDTLRFSGVNVQVVNGTGSTGDGTTGSGNVIVGYNHADGNDAGQRNGSHNLVVGDFHQYTSTGGLVAGRDNAIEAPAASVSGGEHNTASGSQSSVSGGRHNTASGNQSSVSGGQYNTASGNQSSVSGGRYSTASGSQSSVSGGQYHAASGSQSSVSGGHANTASGSQSSVTGGSTNEALTTREVVAGGDGVTCAVPGVVANDGVCFEAHNPQGLD